VCLFYNIADWKKYNMPELPRKDVKIVKADWNGKVGTDSRGREHVMGRYGYGERNDRGERLLEFAEKMKLLT